MKLTADNIKTLQQRVSGKGGAGKTTYTPLSGKYNAVISAVVAKVFKSGSFGLEFAYTITDDDAKGRKVWESIPIKAASGEEMQFAGEKLARRLNAAGLDAKAIGKFELPDSDTEKGDLDTLNGAPVVLKLERDLYNGKATTRVKAVYPADSNSGPQAA